MQSRCGQEAQASRLFVNALRECLGFDPLYVEECAERYPDRKFTRFESVQERAELRRFYSSAFR